MGIQNSHLLSSLSIGLSRDIRLTNSDLQYSMVVKKTHLHLIINHLIGFGFAISPVLVIADTKLSQQKEWACEVNQNGDWQCQDQTSTTEIDPLARKSSSDWDWVPKSKLKKNQPCKTGCEGAYIAPKPDWPNANMDPGKAEVNASSDQTYMENNVVNLLGNVNISQGHRNIKAGNVTLDRTRNELVASGNIEVREPDLLLRANEIFIDSETSLGDFLYSAFLQHSSGMRGRAEKISRESDNVMTLEQGGITQCTPDDELWFVNASKITIDSEKGWGTAKHARVEVKGVPVFYTPYMTFPIDERRKSGFLFPAIGSSGDSGVELSVPYYLNIAPNYDATIAPRIISDRGVLTEAELRHLNPYGSWVAAGAFLKDDDLYMGDDSTINNGTTGGQTPPTSTANNGNFPKQDRWLGNLDHEGAIAGISTGIDYTKVSDNDYFRDLTINSLDAKRQTHLNQQATVGYHIAGWQTNVTAQQYQTLDNDISQQYKFMPRATIEYTDIDDNFTPQWIALTEYTSFEHDQSINDGGIFQTGQRVFGEAGVSFPMQWAAGFIIPTAKVRSVSYDMEEIALNRDDSYSATVPLGTLDMGLIFERPLAEGGFTQTLEPRLFYFYSDYEDQTFQPLFDTSQLTFSYNQLYRDTRFSGHDRLDDANQISAGLTTRFIDNDDGREVFSASIGQIFYFKDRVVNAINLNPISGPIQYPINFINNNGDPRTSNSFVASELQYQPADNLWFSNTLLWDSRQDYLQEGGLSMQYRADNSAVFNAGYRYRRNGGTNFGLGIIPRDLDQLDFSVALPISERWKVFSRFNYDTEENRSIEDMFGVAYSDCCWRVRLIYQRGIEDEFVQQITDNTSGQQFNNFVVERDHAFVLEFQLKGLGGIGDKAASLLERSILGYTDSDD